MTRISMRGLFWELVGLTDTYTNRPGQGTPAGPDVDGLIYQGILEMVRFAMPIHCRKLDTTSLALVVNQASPYNLPTDFFDFLDLEEPLTLSGYPLKQILRGEAEQATATVTQSLNAPFYWYEMGVNSSSPFQRQIGFYPTPSATGTVKLPYLRLPIQLTGTGMLDATEYPDLPPDFHQAPVYYAVWQFFQRTQEAEGTQVDVSKFLDLFTARTQALKSATNERLRPTFRSRTPDYLAAQVDQWMEV